MPLFKVDPSHLMRDVYSYPFPEVRALLNSLRLDPMFMLNTLAVSQANEMLESYEFTPALEIPSHADGSVNLDELHGPVIERIQAVQSTMLVGLDSFAQAYPAHGSSQSMFTLLAEWHAKGRFERLGVVAGEYDGYRAYAEALGIEIVTVDELPTGESDPTTLWFVSNPSAVDGDWIDADRWSAFVDAGHRVVLDAAYLGLVPLRRVEVTAPNIEAVLTSPSKVFGVFRYRNTGITYTREPVAAMYGTKWFKDIPALLDTLALYERFGTSVLPDAYRSTQTEICSALSDLVGVPVVASDVLLLARTDQPVVGENFAAFIRSGRTRFGLAKLFEDHEQR